jgi:hypothetical protein
MRPILPFLLYTRQRQSHMKRRNARLRSPPRAKIIAALISFPMCCHSVACGMTRPTMQSAYAMHSSRSHDAAIRVYDAVVNVIETQQHKSDFKEW